MATPAYTCVNCGHFEPRDPLKLRANTRCKRCGKDYRLVYFRGNSEGSAVGNLYIEAFSLGKKYPKISIAVGFLTFCAVLYYMMYIELKPWGISILSALVSGYVAYLFLVGLVLIVVVIYSIYALFLLVGALGGWG